jgi:hypothetical protein
MKRAYRRVAHAVRLGVLGLDRAVSRRLFRSNAGVYRYLAGERAVARAARACGYARDGSFERGYKELGRIYEPALVDRLAAEFARLIETEGCYDRRGNQRRIFRDTGLEFNRILLDPARRIPALGELINDALAAHLRAYFGAEFRPIEVQGWRNYHMPPEYAADDLLSNHWHNDSFRSDIVKVYVALQDIDERHGPFHYVARPQTVAALAAAGFQRADADVPPGVRPGDVRRFTGPKGSALLVNTTHCLHRAGIPRPGERRDLLELRFQAARAPGARSWPSSG